MRATRSSYDVVIGGGGHNGLTAAAYLSGAGLSVLLLERLGHTGGAAISTEAFPGLGARLSRYSYLVSLMPEQLARDLDLPLELRSRRTSARRASRVERLGLTSSTAEQTRSSSSTNVIGTSRGVPSARNVASRATRASATRARCSSASRAGIGPVCRAG